MWDHFYISYIHLKMGHATYPTAVREIMIEEESDE